MVDTGDLKSPGHCDRAGSSPAPGTIDGYLQQIAHATCCILSFVFDATILKLEPSPSW